MLDRNLWNEKMRGKSPLGKENCPFCSDDKSLLIQDFEHWKLLYNKYPYAGIKKHILLVPKRHIEHVKELRPEELSELPHIEAYIEAFFGDNYFSFIRHTNGGKSIKHLHYHYLPGVLYSEILETLLTQQ